MKKVLLITMPFGTTVHASIGLSLLKAALQQNGAACDIRYFNLDFAAMVGRDRYEDICECQGDKTLLREWLFARDVFNDRIPAEREYMDYLKRLFGGQQESIDYIDSLTKLREYVQPFLDSCLEQVNWEDYDIVGFTTMFEQNLPSVALANRIKQRNPETVIIFGGANTEGELGLELHRAFPVIDYICSGEADLTLPKLVKRIRERQPFGDLAGIVYRTPEGSVATGGEAFITDLSLLPYPDYDDYFAQIARMPADFIMSRPSSGSPPGLPMETSRGCWWGAKSQCLFCSLNRGTISYRSKTPEAALAEMEYLGERYQSNELFMVDNILDMNYFKNLLPELQKRRPRLSLFYETKSNLSREHLRAMRDAGITMIQPGIESLNSHVLKLMRKGVTALQNIQLLKYCAEFSVFPGWSIITGFPGETRQDYRELLDLLPRLAHLPPPNGNSPFSLQRFSPFFADPQRHGIKNIRIEEVYRYIFSFPEEQLYRMAYYFDFDYQDENATPAIDEKLSEAIQFWRSSYENGASLTCTYTSPTSMIISDTRPDSATASLPLDQPQTVIYGFCDRIRTLDEIVSNLKDSLPLQAVRSRDVADFLNDMVSIGLMAREEQRYLSLAVPRDPAQPGSYGLAGEEGEYHVR
ncbi:MAG: RiPP maturation radical SAM protein 1 [Geobacter sp.]|nr:RiPP maturation radical SAM protein 1 [Geobacter sp.]